MTPTPLPAPSRGEVWLASLDPTRGHEQAGTRPALIISVDLFNQGPAGLVIALPITSKSKGVRSHIEVQPPEGGLTVTSYIKCEDVRSLSKDRLIQPYGRVSSGTLSTVADRLRILMDL